MNQLIGLELDRALADKLGFEILSTDIPGDLSQYSQDGFFGRIKGKANGAYYSWPAILWPYIEENKIVTDFDNDKGIWEADVFPELKRCKFATGATALEALKRLVRQL